MRFYWELNPPKALLAAWQPWAFIQALAGQSLKGQSKVSALWRMLINRMMWAPSCPCMRGLTLAELALVERVLLQPGFA
jgi:hypothetical protein